MEVIPPENDGERGITQRELDTMIELEEKIDPQDLEVLPPENPGEQGITQRELDAMTALEEEMVQ